METKTTRKLIWSHLSVLLGCIVPLGNIVGPLLVYYFWKKDPHMRKFTANIVNFHIIWSIILFIVSTIYWYRQIINLSNSESIRTDFLIGIAAGILIVNLLYPVVIAVMVGITKKERLYYPAIIKFMKY